MTRPANPPDSPGAGGVSSLLATLRRLGIATGGRYGDALADPQVVLPQASGAFDDDAWDEDPWDDADLDLELGDTADAIAGYPAPLTAGELLAGRHRADDEASEQIGQIAQALNHLRVTDLRMIATHFGWKLAGQRREDVLTRLLAHYADEDALARARARLSADERRLMAIIRALQVLNVTYLRRALAGLGARTVTGAAFDGERHLREALRHGLIFDLHGRLVSPLGLFAGTSAAADLLPPPPDLRRLKVVPAPDPLRSLALWSEQAGADPLLTALQDPFTKDGPQAPPGWRPGMALSQLPAADDQRPSRIPPVGSSFAAAAVTRFRAALALDRASAAELLLWVYIQLPHGLGGELPEPSDLFRGTVARALGLRGSDLLLLLTQFWQSLPYGAYDEWSWLRLEDRSATFDLESLRSWQRSADPFQEGILRSRSEIAGRILSRLLRADPAQDGWLDLDAFLRFAGQVEPRSAMGGGGEGWQMTDRKGKPLSDWSRGGGAIWRYLIEVPLHVLGLVDLARDRAGATQALRLSAAGRDLMERRAAAAESVPAPEAHWAAEDTVVLPMRWDHLPLMNCLGLCCALASVQDGRASFRLDPTACRATFRAGGDAGAIEQALARLRLSLPPAAAALLRGWSDAWGQWVLRHGWSLLTFADEATAQEIMAAGALGQAVACRLSPTRWLVDPDHADAVLAALQRAGHRPMVHDAALAAPNATPRRSGR